MNFITSLWEYPLGLINDLKTWTIFMRAIRSEKNIQSDFSSFDPELRIDSIGRIYTVVNVPEELWPAEYQGAAQQLVISKLNEINLLMIKHRLQDLLYPEIIPIESPGVKASLIVLRPWTDQYFNIGSFLFWLFQLVVLFFGVKWINLLTIKLSGTGIIENILNLF